MDKNVEKTITDIIDEKLKDHNHDGYGSQKINASSVNVNSFSLKNIRSVTLSDSIKTIDELLSKKQNNIKGTPGHLLSFDVNGEPLGKIDPSKFVQKNHVHQEYPICERTNDKYIPILENGILKNSKISPDEIVIKQDLKNTINYIEDIKKKVIEQKNHVHSGYIQKITGKNSIFIIDDQGSLIDTEITIDDIVLKKDLISLVKTLIEDKLLDIQRQLTEKSNVNHSHPKDDLDVFIKKTDLVNELIKNLNEVKK